MKTPLRILFVEDKLVDFQLVERHLRKHALNVECLRVADRRALDAALAEREWDLVLSDHNVPGLPFEETLERVQARGDNLPLILVSGSVGEERAVELLKLGVWDFVLKDNLTRLVSGIERSLRDAADRHARREAEVALRESEVRFSTAFHASPTPQLIARQADGCLLDANPAFLNLIKCKRDAVIGHNPIELKLATPESFLEIQNELRTHGRIVNRELTLRNSAGQPVYVLGSTELIELKGEACGLATFVDISGRRQAEAALRESEERYRRLFEVESDAIFVVDTETAQITEANAAAQQLYGYSLIELRRMRAMEVSAEPEKTRLAISTGVTKIPLRWHRKKGGTVFPVEITVGYFEAHGRNLHVTAIRDISERWRTQEALQRWADAFNHCAHGITMHVPGSNSILVCNPAFARMLGRTPEQVAGVRIMSLYLPEDHALVQTSIEQADRSGQVRYEARMVRADGSMLPVQMDVISVRNAVGTPTYRIATMQDITERKRADEALRNQQRLLQAVMDLVPHFIFAKDRQSRHLLVNRACAQASGMTPDQMTGKCDLDFVPDRAQAEAFMRDDREVIDSGSPKVVSEESLTNAAGQTRILHTIKIPFDFPGVGPALVGVAVDITEQKQAEAALRASQERFRAYVDQAADALFVHDANGRFLEVNQQACESTGYSREDLLHLEVTALEVGLDRARMEAFWRDIQPGKFMTQVGRQRRKDGSEFPVEIRLGCFDLDGKRYYQGIVRDITERERAAEALRESELRRSLAIEAADMGVWDWNLRTGQLVWSEAHERIFGYPPGGFSGKPEGFKSRIHPDDIADLWAVGERALKERTPFHHEYRIVWPDGSVHWLTSHGQYVFDTEDKPLRMVGVVHDITARKRAEVFRQASLRLGARLNATRHALDAGRALLATADELWKWDAANLDLVAADGQHVRTLLEVDVVAGQRQELPIPETAQMTPRICRLMSSGAELIVQEASTPSAGDIPFGDTRRRSATIMSVPIRRNHHVVGVLSIHSYTPNAYTREDLQTLQALADHCGGALERIRSEEALETSEARYRGLVETTFDWVWEVDANGRYTYASPQVEKLLGYTPGEVLGKTPFDFMPEAEAQRVGETFRGFAAARVPFSALENRNRHKDGREIVLETSGMPVLGPKGEFLGYRGMDRDVTERKRLEAQFRQAQKLEAVGQLAGGVAHDFNNIIAARMMHLSLLQSNPLVDAETRVALRELQAEAKRAATLTRQLLAFSRRSVLAIQLLDLNDVVANLLKMLTRLIGENIKLNFESRDGLPLVEADAGMMEQVIMNLVVNARDAMPKSGRITIRTGAVEGDANWAAGNPNRQPGRFVSLAVMDTGCGMDTATLRRIFEPFFTTKESGKGTGLGLATVHGIVAQHNGWVEVASEVGRGSTFQIFLAARGGVIAEAEPAAPPPPIRHGQETILLVEDETTVRRLAAKVLRTFGYEVFEAANGQEALKVWQAHGAKVDLLFTDMVMPEGMTGLELTEQLQSLKPELRAIISSGYSSEMVQSGAPSRAGILYLPKPYAAEVLGQTVRDFLDQNPKTR